MERSAITAVNEFLVLDAIRSAGQATRPQLGASLGLSQASVSRIVRRLLAQGLVTEEPGESEGVGRSRDVLRFNRRAGAVIAIDLGGTKCHGALADLAGDVVREDLRQTFAGGSPARSLIGSIAALRGAAVAEGLPVEAVSVGIPAVINPDTGLVDAGPNVHWHEFDLLGLLREELSEPFVVENDVNLAGLGEAWRGGGVGIGSFVTLSLGTGIGAAIVLEGNLVRGRHNAAGEIGYLVTSRSQLRGGPAAGLEALISGASLASRAQRLIKARPGRSSLDAGTVTPELVFQAAAAGDPVARTVIGELVEQVAVAVAAVAALVDPHRVILDGSIGRALGPYLPRIDALVQRAAYHAPELTISTLGPNATVIGGIAAALARHRELSAPAVPPIAPLRESPGPGPATASAAAPRVAVPRP
jgi:glucokinase